MPAWIEGKLHMTSMDDLDKRLRKIENDPWAL
jgi:hypothetical protein